MFRRAVGQQDCVLTRRKEFAGFFGSRNGHVECVRAQSAIVELRKFAGASGKISADSQRPERAAQTKTELFPCGFGSKFSNTLVGSAGEKKEFIEIAQPNEFRLALRQAGVLGKFPGRERAQRHYGNSRVFGKEFESLRGSRLRRSHGDAGEAA